MAGRFAIWAGFWLCAWLSACAAPLTTTSSDHEPSSVAEPSVVYAEVGADAVAELSESAAEIDASPLSSAADEVVCLKEQKTGTHLRRRVCRTARERDSMRRDSQSWMRSGGLEGGAVVRH